jgi:ribosomal protein S18 acetylase RimI-like enzyme
MNISALISARVMAAATRGTHSVIGPFVVNLHQASASAARNYAIPVDGAEPTRQEIADLVAHFVENDRVPRLELIAEAAPAVAPALAAAGFQEDDRLPQLAAAPDARLTPRLPADVVLALADPDDADLLAIAALQNRAYGETEPPNQGDVDRLQRCIARGVLITTARAAATGDLIGAGLIDVTGRDDPIGELAAVATAEEHRRRGVAGGISAFLAEAAFARGMALVFLECEAKNVGVYRKTGFTDCGERLWMSLPATSRTHTA